MIGLAGWHISETSSGNDKQSLKHEPSPGCDYGRSRVLPRKEHKPCPISLTCFPAFPPNGSTPDPAHLCPRRRQGTAAANCCTASPRTHVMWHRVARSLRHLDADHRPTCRATAGRTCRTATGTHTPYTKRAMAQTMNRGDGAARPCAFRTRRSRPRRPGSPIVLRLTKPGPLSRLAVLDILPTYEYWQRINRLYALKIYHLDLSGAATPVAGNADRRQSRLLPALQDGEPDQIEKSRRHRSARAQALSRRVPRSLAGACDVRGLSRRRLCRLRDRQGRSRLRKENHDPDAGVVGDAGIASAAATPLDTWKSWATNVSGMPIDYGHFLTEENPAATAKALREFSRRGECLVSPRAKCAPSPACGEGWGGGVSAKRRWSRDRLCPTRCASRVDLPPQAGQVKIKLPPHLEKLPQ